MESCRTGSVNQLSAILKTNSMIHQKPIIYQLLPRLFTNYCTTPVVGGTLQQNGSGKLNDINSTILGAIRDLGATHVWYTGIIEHAHDVDYTSYGISRQNPHIVKGKAGSPYAICDYYDIDPDLAVDVPGRMAEFEALVDSTHEAVSIIRMQSPQESRISVPEIIMKCSSNRTIISTISPASSSLHISISEAVRMPTSNFRPRPQATIVSRLFRGQMTGMRQ